MGRRDSQSRACRRTGAGARAKLPRPTAITTAIAAAFGATPTLLLAAANNIDPDGRTATSVTAAGGVTEITTGTIRGDNAFNSFHHFQVAQGNTVNLRLPSGTDNLINLVHDSRAVIDGTLNSLVDGRIGGNVVFADPHGIVVGATGVVNVGSLLLSAPTPEFMNQIIDGDGNIDDLAAQRLLSGEAPLSTTATIDVQGTVNAFGAVILEGQGVLLGGAVHAGSDAARAGIDAAHQALFEAAVNTDGIEAATEVAVVDGAIRIRAAGDVGISGVADASSAETGGNAGFVAISAGGNVAIDASAIVRATGAVDGGDGGRVDIDAGAGIAVDGLVDASGAQQAGAVGDGGNIALNAGGDLAASDTATLAAAGAADGGAGGRFDLTAGGTMSIASAATLDVSAGARGDGGVIELAGAGTLALSGINADLSAGDGGTAGQLLLATVNVNLGGTEYYTNGGDVVINAGDSLTIASGTVINTRRIDAARNAVEITPASELVDNPAGLASPEAADSFDTASEGDSGNVVLQAPNITVEDGAVIYTFATDGFNAGNVSLVSGDNFTCNICEARDPGDYFSGFENVGNSIRVASTDDVSITVASGAVIDARYVQRSEYTGAAGQGGDVVLSADASDMQVAGFSFAGSSVLVNGALRGANVSVTASADAGVDFAWLATLLDPMNPAPALTLLQEISSSNVEEFHQNAIENVDDWSDVTNLLGVLGLPVTAGVAIADANVEIGDTAVIEASGDVTIDAQATRTVLGAPGAGLLTGTIPELGLSVIYGHISGTTSARVTGGAQIRAGGAVNVTATSENTMEVASAAMVTQSKTGVPTKGNTSLAFSAAMSYVDVTTEAVVGADARIHDAGAVEVRATGVDKFTTEASSLAATPTSGATAKAQGGVTAAVSLWSTDVLAAFDARLADGVRIGSLDVVADSIAEAHVTKTTVQTGNNFFDYLLGTPANRQSALNGLISGALGKTGSAGAPKFAAAASITVSSQNATARIGENAVVRADGDVTVRSRVVDQGIRSISDSRVNSTGPGEASISGSVAFAYAEYDHASHAVIGDGAIVEAEHIGVGARSELPIDNDYDEAFGDFDVTQWSGPADFFTALNSIVNAVLQPDVPALESFGLADYLLTGYSNAYGDATENGTAIFGSANALVATQDTRAWVGEGAQLTATGAAGEWTSEFAIDVEKADELDISAPATWTWSAPVDVDARTLTESIGVTGNLSLLTLITSRNAPAGNAVGGSFGWNQFDSTTIAGIGDGAVVRAAELDVEATATDHMIVIAPSAGVGTSMAGNGIFSYAQIDGVTHAGIHDGAHIDADSVNVLADHNVNIWAIGGAVAVSSGTSIGAAVAINNISSDTRAYIGDNSADRVLEEDEDANAPAADVVVADGSEAGVRTASLNVEASSEGRVGAIGVAGAVARSAPSTSAPAPSRPAPPATPTNNSFLGALKSAGGALGGGGSTPGGQSATLTGSGSGTLNFSRLSTVAEIDGTTLLNDADDAAPDINVRALTNVDQVSASGSAAVSIAGGGGGRSSAFAGAVAFNDIDNHTRAGIYDFSAPNGGSVGSVDVLAATSGDALSIGIALAAASGQSTAGASGSVSIADISADTTAEIEDSEFTADAAGDKVSVTGYDRSRVLAGGGALYLGLGGGSGGGVGFAATYGRVDNDVSAYVRGSTLTDFDSLSVSALGASRILAGAFGGSVATGNSASGAGSLYIMTLDGDLAAGITGSYGTTTDENGDEVTDYANLERRSDVDTGGDVTVTAASSAGVAEVDGLFSADGGFDDQADFNGNALADIDPAQTGIDPDASIPGEAVLGFAGSLAVSGGNAAAGMAIGFTDLQGSYTAEIRDADITATAGDVDVTAVNSRQAIGVAAGASVSGSGGPFTLLGSGAITLSDTTVSALVHGDSRITADHVDIAAGAEGTIYSLAGSLSLSASGSAALGAAASYNDIGGSVSARLGGSSVITDGVDPSGDERTVDVTADQDADIRSLAVAGAATGGSVAIGGSATINTITTNTSATLDADAVTADTVRTLVRNGSIADRVGVWSLAGSITASNTAGFGAAIAVNTLGGSYDASVEGTTFTGTDELIVRSTAASEVKTLAASGGASGQVSAGVSSTTSTGSYAISAGLTDVDLTAADARVDVYAGDDSTISSLAGAVQIGGTAAVGAAVSVNSLSATVDADISGGVLDVENVLVQARSHAEIDTIAVGVAGSGSGSVSGSVAVNHVDSATRAVIDGGATVAAAHNVGVLAGSDDSVSIGAGSVAISGAVLGGAGSVTVNVLEGTTEAAIRGVGTRVEARGEDDTDTVSASGGQLASVPTGNPFAELFGDGTGDIAAPSASDFSGYGAPDLLARGNAETGVVVDAIALQQASNVVATAGVSADFVGGGVGVAGAVNTTVLGGSASALVENATIGNADARNASGDLTVSAGHHAYGTNVMLGLAAGSAGGVGTISVDTYSGAAIAAIRDADVYAGGAVDLDAVSRRDLLTVIAGLSVGTYGGVTGSGAISVFDGTTTAEIIGGSYVEAASADLRADSDTEQDLIVVGLAGSGGFGGSGSLAVAVSESDTMARIGDGADRTEVHTDGMVRAEAVNATRLNSVAASAAIAGGALAGAVGVQYIGNRTEASLDNALVDAGGALDVTADDAITLDAVAGSGAVGGVAAGVGVNVGVIKSTTAAEVVNSDVTTGGAVTVDATRDVNLEVDSIVASASFGGGFAASGGVSVLLFGGSLDQAVHEDAGGDLGDELGDANGEGSDGDWLDKADDFRTTDHLSTTDDDGNTVDRAGGAADGVAGGGAGDDDGFAGVRGAVYGAGDDGVSATISGGTVNAGHYERVVNAGEPDAQTLVAGDRPVTVTATDNVRTRNEVIAVSVGGAISAGGGVAVTQVNSDVSATATADELRASTLTVRAASRNGTDDDGNAADAVRTAGYSGAAGLVGIGAAVGVGMLDGTVNATVGGDINLRDGADVIAADDTTASVNALGASVGFAGAVGVAVAVADRDATVNASMLAGSSLEVVGDDAGTRSDVEIRADARGGAEAVAEAAAGGLFFAGNGGIAVSSDNRTVTAGIGAGSTVVSGGNLSVIARTLPDVSAIARGGAIAYGGSVGASVASAGASTTLSAGIGDGSIVFLGRGDAGGSLTVSAEQHAPNSTGDWADGYDGAGIRAESDAVNGAVYLAANAATAHATDRGSVTSRVGDGVVIHHEADVGGDLPAGSGVTVEAVREAGLLAETSGIVGAALAVGASVAVADSDASTDAYFGGGMGFQSGSFRLDASSVTDVVADAVSGSGGLVAGAAADATVRDDADTTAELGGASLVRADEVNVLAHHQSRFRPAASSVQAAAVGYSGSAAHADIDTTVTTRVADAVDMADGGYARVLGYDVSLVSDADVSRETLIGQAPEREYSVEGGAGGVVNGAAADSDVVIDKSSTVEIGDAAYLRAFNTPDATANSGLAALTLLANGSVNVNDRAYLGAGGAIQAPYASSEIDLTGSTRVEVGDSVRLMSEDLLGISAFETQVDATASAVTKTWGGVGFAGATTDADVTYTQTVNVGTDSLLEGLGYTFLTAGRRADTVSTVAESLFDIAALSDTYNYTALPLDTDIDASARLHTDASVSLGAGSEVIAGWDVAIGGVRGQRNVIGKGTGHNPYLELLSTEITERDESVTGSTWLSLDGDVVAGYFNKWAFQVADDGQSVEVTLNGEALDPERAAQDVDAYVDLMSGFDAQGYVEALNEQVAELGETYQSFAEQVETAGLPGSVDVVRIHDVTATQGNVLVYGDSLAGGGTLEARGGASIGITNASEAWIDVADLNVIDNIGGRVLFTGAIDAASTGGVTVNQVDAEVSPAIAVVTSGNTGAASADGQPGLLISGPLYNQRGLVRLYNRSGNIYQGSVVQANQVQVVAPNGTYVIIAPDQTIHAGGTPWSAWDGAEFAIGASDVIAYALRDYVENVRGVSVTSGYALENYLYEHWGTGTGEFDPGGDAEPYMVTYDISLVPYNAGSLTGSSGARPYVIFDDENRQARFDSVPLKAFSQARGYGAIDESGPAGGGVRANKVLILADVLDINAPIIAGQESDITIDLDADMATRIAEWRGTGTGERLDLTWYHESGLYQNLPEFYRQLLGLPDVDEASGEGWYALAPGEAIPFTADRTVSGYYDRATDRIVMNGVQGATTGYISVDAKIVSTTKLGRLEVVNGYSDITLNNTTGHELVLNDVSTGTAETGVIEITDRLRDQRTWYVNRIGGTTRKYVTTDLTAASWLDDGVTEADTDLGVYRPEQGTRFWWERRYRAARRINSTDYFDSTATPWEFVDGDWTAGSTGTYNGDIIDSGLCGAGTCRYSGSSDFHQQVTDTDWYAGGSWTEGAWYHFTYDESVAGWGSNFHGFHWPLRAEMETHTSVRADYPIEIRFSGSSTGSINVSSNAGITVAGRLESRGGDVTMNVSGGASEGIAGSAGSLISAVNGNLKADGDIGGASAPLRVSLDGVLNAGSAYGAVNVSAPAGDLRLGTVTSTGAVRLSADQSLLGTDAGISVTGELVELSAGGGRIGHQDGGALQVSAGSRLDAVALDDILLTQPSGDLHLGSLLSLDGDVSVTAEGGNIVSATNMDVSDLVPLEELRQRWAELGITGDAAADDGEVAIAAFESLVEREYRRYWQFAQAIERGDDGSLQVTEAGERLYTGLADANGLSVADYVVGEYQRLGNFFVDLLGTPDLGAAEGFAEFDAAWRYTASAERRAGFRNGAEWSEKRLENAVNAAAVSSGAAGVSWLDDTLNVSGRNVTLRASGDIGSFGTHAFRLSPDTTITDQQRRWLLTAAPGGLLIEQATDAAGAVDVDVRTLSRLRVSARGNLDVQAGTDGSSRDIFIGADGDARIERLEADGEIYLGAQQDIRYTGTGQVIAGAAEGLTLRAVGGSILGFDGDAFDLAIDGTLIGAIGNRSVRLSDVGGAAGLDVGILYAQDELAVHVPGDLRQVQGRGFAIGARSLWLDVGGSAGAVGDGSTGFAGPLNLAMRGLEENAEAGLDGTVSGGVGGDLYLSADARGLRLGGVDLSTGEGALSSRELTVGGLLTLTSEGDVTIGGDVATGAGATVQSSGQLLMDGPFSLTAALGDVSLIGTELGMVDGAEISADTGRLNVGVTGDATLGLLRSGLAGDVDTAPAITITAGGGVQSARSPGALNLLGSAPQGVQISAGADIGSDTTPLVIAGGGTLTAAAGGSIHILALDAVDGGDLDASGDIDLTGNRDIALDAITAGGDIRIDATGALSLGALESVAGGVNAIAGGGIGVETAVSETDQYYAAGGDIRLGTVLVRDGGIDVDAGGRIELGSIITSEAQVHLAAGDFSAGTLISSGSDVRVQAGGAIDVGEVEAAIDVVMDAAADLSIGNALAGRDLRLDTGAALTLDGLRAGRDITTESVGDTSGGTIIAGRDLQVAAGFDEGFEAAPADILLHAVSGRAVDLTATDAIRVVARDGYELPGGFIDAGTTVTLTAGDGIEVPTITAGDNVTANGAMLDFGTIDSGANVRLDASGDISAAAITAAADVTASGAMLDFGTIDSGADVRLDALENIVVVSVDSAGLQGFAARGDLDFGRLDAGGTISTASGGDTRGDTVRSDASVTMVAGMGWSESGEPAGVVDGDAELLIDSVAAPEVLLHASGNTAVGRILASQVAELQGRTITATVRDTDGERLDMVFAGGNGGLAERVRLDVDSDGEIVFGTAYAVDARIDTSSDRVVFEDGWIRDMLRVSTANTELLMDQIDPAALPVDVQLIELDERFRLIIDGRTVFSDAYLEHYRPGWQVVAPNFQEDHDEMGLTVGGESAERNVTRTLVRSGDLPTLDFGTSLPPSPAMTTPPMRLPLEGAPVNLGEGAPTADSGTGDNDDTTEI
jgi:filamentous hemagglutinin family protein